MFRLLALTLMAKLGGPLRARSVGGQPRMSAPLVPIPSVSHSRRDDVHCHGACGKDRRTDR
jgi:hypothetical protein